MSKPVIVVLSRDAVMTSEVPDLFEGRADVRTCDSIEEFLDLSSRAEPQALLADFRRIGSGGHAENRILESLTQRFPKLRVAMLTSDDCPEPLARLAAMNDIAMCRGRLDRATLMKAFHTLFPAEVETVVVIPQSPIPAVAKSTLLPNDLGAERSLGALTGVGRRFETNSPQLKQMLDDLEVAARHDVTILLIGETGAGKTFLSKLIHEVSPRRHEPFLPVACGALPADLIEGELFGHMKGSFTSAHADKEGKFLAARRGSILLDEIDVLGPEQQVKLLRVIETGEFEPVGSNQTQHCQARLIVASNLELQPLVEQGRFRPDLYYRLNMLKFVIPPLRQRKMDIMSLARKFTKQFAIKHGVRIEQIEPSLFSALINYPWPGNVRELEHVIQRSVIYCTNGTLSAENLPHHILSGTAGPTNDPTVNLGHSPTPSHPTMTVDRSLGNQVALSEKEIIEQALFKNTFSRTKTAKELGISRVTLYNKMKRYGLLR